MKPLFPYAAIFAVLIIAAWLVGNWDPIGPAIAEARAETRVGLTTMNVIDTGMTYLFKWLFAASLAGMAGAAFVEARKVYKKWMRDQSAGRWSHFSGMGPSTGQQRPTAALPKLTREDLFYLSLAQSSKRTVSRTRGPSADERRDDEIDLEI